MNDFKENLKVEPKPDKEKKEQAKAHLTAQQFEELMRKVNEEVWEK